MSIQSGSYEHSYEDSVYPDQDLTNQLRCFRYESDDEYTDLLNNVNTPRELLSTMESFEESSNEIPSETEARTSQETRTSNQFSNSRLGQYDENRVSRRRNDRIINRGILNFYSKRLQKQLVGRLVRNSGRTQINTVKPSNDEVLLNAHIAEQSKRHYGVERPFPVSYQQMELCHKDAFENPIERERSFDQFFRAVERRMGILGDQLCRAFENNTINARRILHDSIELRRSQNFREMVFDIRKVLDKRGSYAIWFHETNKGTEDYPEDISRGYPPDYDFGVIPTGFRYCGKPAVEPVRVRIGRRNSINTRLEFKAYKYYPETKVYSDIERAIYEEESFEEPTEGHFHVLHACKWYNNECR